MTYLLVPLLGYLIICAGIYLFQGRLVYFPERELWATPVEGSRLALLGFFNERPEFLDIALRQALGFDQQQRDIPVRYMLDTDRLRSWLEAVALEYDRGPQPARVVAPESEWADSLTAASGLPAGYVEADYPFVFRF